MTQSTSSTAGRWPAILGAVAAGLFVVGPLSAFLGILPPRFAFTLFGVGGLLGLVTLAVSIVVAVSRGISAANRGLLLGSAISVIFVILAVPARNYPRINDITTTPDDPPQFVHANTLDANVGRDMSYPGESFAQQQRAAYPDLAPLELPIPADEAFDRVKAAAEQMPGWKITRVDTAARAVEGVDTSQLFRFKDDFVIEVRQQDDYAAVHMRSKSRVGRSDVGVNAARIEAFFARLR